MGLNGIGEGLKLPLGGHNKKMCCANVSRRWPKVGWWLVMLMMLCFLRSAWVFLWFSGIFFWGGMVWYGKTIPRKSWVVFIPYHFPRKNGQFSHGEIHPALSTAARCGPTCSSQRAAPSLCRGPSASSSWDPLTSWCVPSWTMTRRLLDLFVGWMKIYLIEFNLYSHSISRIL